MASAPRSYLDLAPDRILRRHVPGQQPTMLEYRNQVYVPLKYYVELYRLAHAGPLAPPDPAPGGDGAPLPAPEPPPVSLDAAPPLAAASDLLAPLTATLDAGLRQLHDRLSRTATAAGVGFLVNHALARAWQAHASGRQPVLDLMLYSLHALAQHLRQFRGGAVPGFAEAAALLDGHAPPPPPRSAKSHPQHLLFQLVLKDLRDFGGLDLYPFLYDLDDDGHAFGLG